MNRWLGALLLFVSGSLYAADHATVLLYHHVSEDTPTWTSVTPEQFRAHLEYLEQEQFQVLPLNRVLDHLRDGEALPENTVVISFDDAYLSTYTAAWPLLQARGWPFTVFVATQAVDRGYKGYMSWEQMAAMPLAEYGAHSVSHGHLLEQREGENAADRRARMRTEIDTSAKRIEEALGVPVRSFAYPYGEYDEELAGLVEELGLYGIAQQSGAVGPMTSLQQVPRYPLSGPSATVERLRTVVRSRPLPVASPAIHSHLISPEQYPPRFEFTLADGEYRRNALACYSSRGGALSLSMDGDEVQVELPASRAGRNKINCTAPARNEPGAFFWYSHLWIVADPAGRWLTR